MAAKSSKKIGARTSGDLEMRRAQIVDETISVIGQRGYHGFTVQELAHRCGLTNGGVLYHFGSKEKLLVAVLEERDRREAEKVTPASADAESKKPGRSRASLTTILQVLRLIMARCAAQPELVRLYAVLQSESLDSAHPAHEYFLRREAMALREFTKMVAPHVAEPHSTARQIHALMDGLSLQWLREEQRFDLVTEWDRAIAMALPGSKRRRSR
jgi:AcrR family transcriptional regulator